MSPRRGARTLLALLLGSVLACAGAAPRAREGLTVGTSGDYAPFSMADAAGGLSGFELTLARAFARDEGLALTLSRFAWPRLTGDLTLQEFDVAMSGVTVRPERSVVGRFGVPVAESGAVVLVPAARADGGLPGLDVPGVRIAVNAGGHLERVARRTFPRAALVTFPENDAVRRALAAGTVDAAVTDTLEAPHWQRTLGDVARLGPFTRDRKAPLWAVGSGTSETIEADAVRAEHAERFDAWLLAREADGSLAAWRQAHLGAPGPETATPLAALLASVAERLALMPLVAEAKRAGGGPVRDPAREALVLRAARQAVAERAREVGVAPPGAATTDAFYRAQIEAAVAIQERVLAQPAQPDAPAFDLARELRPALLRIGDRMAFLLVRLGRIPDAAALRAAVSRELAEADLGSRHADPLAQAILALSQSLTKARASSPAITGSTSETP